MNALRPDPGTVMMMQWRKWNGGEHWGGACVYLGSDEHGDWIGKPTGSRYVRPGASYVTESPSVALLPRGRTDQLASFHRDHPRGLRVYIDLAWDLRWSDDGASLTGIDMDLDVVRRLNEQGTYVDDRDEWFDHETAYGYPADVVTHLEVIALDLEERVRAQLSPFDDTTADVWLDRMAVLVPALHA